MTPIAGKKPGGRAIALLVAAVVVFYIFSSPSPMMGFVMGPITKRSPSPTGFHASKTWASGVPGYDGPIATLDDLPKFLADEHADADVAARVRRVRELYYVSADVSHVSFPPAMVEKMKAKGHDLDAFAKQQSVLIQNALLPHETLTYNAVRAHRFGPSRAADNSEREKLLKELDAQKCQPPDLCNVPAMTATNPAVRGGTVSWAGVTTHPDGDGGGHLENSHAITFSNMGHNAGMHAVIVAKRAWNPLRLSVRDFEGLFALTRTYFVEAHRGDPQAVYPSFIFDSLRNGGASQMHPHFQGQLHKHRYTGRWEAWRRAASTYRAAHGGQRDYFQDVVDAHAFLGLAFAKTAHFVAYVSLTAATSVEVVLVGDAAGVMEADAGTQRMHELGRIFHATFRAAYSALEWDGVSSACAFPPVRGARSGGGGGGGGLPVVCRIAPRGSYYGTINDVSANELFGNTVAMGDIFSIARELRAKIVEDWAEFSV